MVTLEYPFKLLKFSEKDYFAEYLFIFIQKFVFQEFSVIVKRERAEFIDIAITF